MRTLLMLSRDAALGMDAPAPDVFPFVAECSVSLSEALALSGLPMAAIFMA
ncbi:MAG: hypothetical protein ABSG53_32895 [Thermoguttaceae bacterium]